LISSSNEIIGLKIGHFLSNLGKNEAKRYLQEQGIHFKFGLIHLSFKFKKDEKVEEIANYDQHRSAPLYTAVIF